MRIRIALLVMVLVGVLAPPAADARDFGRDLWATVNVCDTAKSPDTIGIRASMPGVPRGARLAMRFRVQYQSDHGWQDVKGASSGWRPVGIARGIAVQSGWSFTFARPSSPVALRGMVQFRWRRGGVVLHLAELATETGHRSSAGADPAGYSAATCVLGS